MSDEKAWWLALDEIFDACQHFFEAVAAYQAAIEAIKPSATVLNAQVESAWGRINRYGMRIIRIMQACGLRKE